MASLEVEHAILGVATYRLEVSELREIDAREVVEWVSDDVAHDSESTRELRFDWPDLLRHRLVLLLLPRHDLYRLGG